MSRRQENFRSDEVTTQLLLSLINYNNNLDQKNKTDKSKVIRRAIYRLATEELPEEVFNAAIQVANDIERY